MRSERVTRMEIRMVQSEEIKTDLAPVTNFKYDQAFMIQIHRL